MPPKASTSGGGTKAKGGGKLGPIEQKLLDVGSLAPNREIIQGDLMQQCGLSVTPAVQDAVNGLLRKNLMQMLRTQSGQIMFRFLKKEEAKAIGAMDSEEKLVLDYIKEAGSLGIWTKFLTNKTGLARTTMTKVLKILEGRKSIKTVKSVKYPTRKIYMLAGIQPSVELTGGPWFTDNELDTELVDTLKKVVQKHLTDHSIPKNQSYHPPDDPLTSIRYRPIYPVTATPFLPGIESILNYISSTEVIQVELQPTHAAALMNLMVYDGIVERVYIGNPEERKKRIEDGITNAKASKNEVNGKKSSTKSKDKKGKRKKVESSSEEESEEESDDGKKKKKGKKSTVKRSKSGKAKKKRSKREESDEEEEDESSESDFDEDAPAKSSKKKRKGRGSDDEDEDGSDAEETDEDDSDDEGGKRKKKKGSSSRKKKDRSKKKLKALASDEEDSDDDPLKKGSDDEDVKPKLDEHAVGDDEENLNDYVYRLIRPYTPVIGWTDMPCGKCPVEEFCSEPLRPRAGVVKKPTTVSDSYLTDTLGGGPRVKIELEGGIQGVGMLGGAGAAVGVSLAKWGEMKGQVGKGVAPVNPRDCVYFKEWLTMDHGEEE
ncbi:uncharacterized protein JCM6883_000878 [Sporobolomyces salmoneus]|uniref:uncharacterized protein n=1 Tax=Sporobolomyces salmoneus TaxID=183962 RepID=UPI0031707ADA